MTDREFVEQHWQHCTECDGSYRHYPKGTVLLVIRPHCFIECDSWDAAAEITRDKLEERRQLIVEAARIETVTYLEEDEMESAIRVGRAESAGISAKRIARMRRTHARLLLAAVEIEQGMKPTLPHPAYCDR